MKYPQTERNRVLHPETSSCREPLKADEWRRLSAEHKSRVARWTEPYRKRRACGELHPIHDFLFIYYRNPPSQLEAWHPDHEAALELPEELPEDWKPKFYTIHDSTIHLDLAKMDPASYHRLEMAHRLSSAVQKRPPQFGCFGLHEWAMVYRGDMDGEIRHAEKLPLRLGQEATDAFVESRSISCTHYDAFRFFTPTAKPFNRIQPCKDTRVDNEQSGCLHTNMDLYKLSAQCMPWIGSELLWHTFEFAVKAREIDMRASPYDCSSLGYEPIKIETAEGRAEYECAQRALHEKAKPIRAELIAKLESIFSAKAALTA